LRACQASSPTRSGAGEALAFYQAAFGAKVDHLVGGEEIVASCRSATRRSGSPTSRPSTALQPESVGGGTVRLLLITDDPDAAVARAIEATTEVWPVGEEHGWRFGRVLDPYGHHWEIGKPLVPWRRVARLSAARPRQRITRTDSSPSTPLGSRAQPLDVADVVAHERAGASRRACSPGAGRARPRRRGRWAGGRVRGGPEIRARVGGSDGPAIDRGADASSPSCSIV
jgi:PhnB protein